MELTENEKKVLSYLNNNRGKGIRPTEIGREVGGYNSKGTLRHSAWACPILKRLIHKGLVNPVISRMGGYTISQFGVSVNNKI